MTAEVQKHHRAGEKRDGKRMELWRSVPEGQKEAMPGGRCPRCTSKNVHRSRSRRGLEGALRTLTPLRAFKCGACHWRGLRVPVPDEGHEVLMPPLPATREHGHRGHRVAKGGKSGHKN